MKRCKWFEAGIFEEWRQALLSQYSIEINFPIVGMMFIFPFFNCWMWCIQVYQTMDWYWFLFPYALLSVQSRCFWFSISSGGYYEGMSIGRKSRVGCGEQLLWKYTLYDRVIHPRYFNWLSLVCMVLNNNFLFVRLSKTWLSRLNTSKHSVVIVTFTLLADEGDEYCEPHPLKCAYTCPSKLPIIEGYSSRIKYS